MAVTADGAVLKRVYDRIIQALLCYFERVGGYHFSFDQEIEGDVLHVAESQQAADFARDDVKRGLSYSREVKGSNSLVFLGCVAAGEYCYVR